MSSTSATERTCYKRFPRPSDRKTKVHTSPRAGGARARTPNAPPTHLGCASDDQRVAHFREPDPCLVGGKEKMYYALNETWQRPTCFVCLGFDYDPQNPTTPGGVDNREGDDQQL